MSLSFSSGNDTAGGTMPGFDVAVIGGGPAGSVCAARLASRGRRVVVFERARHPRFHLGESLLPASLGVLETVGVLDEVRRRFLTKRGARMILDGSAAAPARRYTFADAFGARWDHAFQVPRDEFDEMLFRHAGNSGADLREGWEVRRVVFEAGRAVGVEVKEPGGATRGLAARFVVDASGRDATIARGAGVTARMPHLDRTAFFAQFRGAWRDEGEREGDIQIVVFGEGEERGWFWLIPFADGRTSVGAVVSSTWVRARRPLGGPEALFDAAVAQAPTVAGMLDGATRVFAPEATADYSFRVSTIRGEGWLAIGDAGGFIDPLFSTGVHLAMHGALRAADAIDAALDDEVASREQIARWEREVRTGADLFIGAVQAFYSGDLVGYLFAEPQHPFMRRAITSMLSGDVFDENVRWAREMRSMFPVRG